MNLEETKGLLETIRASFPKCYNLNPDVAQHAWHAALRSLMPGECLGAVNHFLSNTDLSPTPKGIREFCENNKRAERMRRMRIESNTHYKTADASFLNVPGKNRTEQVIYVQAEWASRCYRNGKTDNEFFNDLLIKGKALGFEFEGVDYKNLKGSGKAWKSLCGLGTL